MPADISRLRLDPFLDYAGVTLKQGGVLLDADLNELNDIVDRRLRALASDVLGRATVSSTTVDAFKVSVAAGALSIGVGRLYVDGLLAENHGAASADPAKRRFDDLLAEQAFTDPVPYTAQPYLPQPPALPIAGRHLVYLDVWDREVTHVEQPDLVESAVGVEATARVQTVWQVRALAEQAGAGATCASPDADLAGWASLIAPSTGRLTTGTFEVAAADDPCELPPTGGYRGLENQTYRVEIHDGGQPGAGATFKWSRENASVAARVASIVSAGELELTTLGRDDVLSFKTGDWVEIVDDAREFAQLPGEMRRVTVNEAIRRITFSPALPAAMLPASFPDSTFPDARHLRVRRWDHRGQVFRTAANGATVSVQDLDAAGSPGTIAVPTAATTLLLENGVTVAFTSVGTKGFRPGDYWVFAARTADASVELLDRAPPRGIHHHYARLALWDVGAGTVTDCRHPWPPATTVGDDCSCTACVTVQSHASGQFTIQDAVNQASQTGGTVCIGPGQYALQEPVRLVGTTSVRIVGQGPATVLVASGGAFLIRDGRAVGIERLAIFSAGRQPAIVIDGAIGLTLDRLVIAVLGSADFRASAIALEGLVAAAAITNNAILAAIGILANDPTVPRESPPPAVGTAPNAPQPFLLAAALDIDENIFWCRRRAIQMDGRVAHLLDTRIVGNEAITCAETAISMGGIGLPGSSIRIAANAFAVAAGGIACALDGALIEGNKVVNTDAAERRGSGIALTTGLLKTGTTRGQILANQIGGFGLAGITIAAPVADLIVKLNIIEDCGNGIIAIGEAKDGALSIENNHLRRIGPAGDSPAAGTAAGATASAVIGIGVTRAGSATVAGNTIHALGLTAVRAGFRVGIYAIGVGRVRVAGNEIADLAPPGDFIGRAAGILLQAPLLDFEVSHNRVERETVATTTQSNGQWAALSMLDLDPQANAATVAGTTAIRVDAERTFVLGAGRAFIAGTQSTVRATAERPAGATGSVLGNSFGASGDSPAVEIVAGQCLFNDNRVEARLNRKVAVTVAASVMTASANRIVGGEVSLDITRATAKSAAVVGNVTTGAVRLAGAQLAAPWNALNLRA